ncbi:retrotransposon protein, putative, ty1-copia subclass [Tanacetum coccineum]
MRYVKGTLTHGVHFSCPKKSMLIGYSNADWACCIETRSSTYGYSIFFGGNLVSSLLCAFDWSYRETCKSHMVLGIAPAAIIDRQLPFEYTITSRSTDVVVMALPVQNINHSAFRSMFEREKLSGTNFNDWLRRLKLVLRVEKKMFVIEQPIPPAPAANSEANVLAEWNALYDAYNEVACLMLGSMTPELHRQFENYSPYDMLQELKSMFEKQAGVERFDLIQTFHACKHEEGKPVGAYVLKMKDYVEQLERLGYVLPQDLSVGLILNGLTSDFTGFVRNYNMHNMGKTIGELHAMLIEYEKGLPKKAETPQVMMIKGGKIQKANKKSLKAKGKGKANGKGKDKHGYISKPKNPKPTAKEHPAKDDTCHHCKEVGHWKRNCPVFLAELLKKKKQVGTASSSGIFTIELFAFPNKSWVYDTGCGTHVCITKQGFREARKLKQGALYLYVGNGVRAQVEAIGSFDLVLPNGLVICLDNCHYAPSITRGVVSVHRLVENGFVQCFTDFGISVSKNNVHYFNAIPSNGIYEIDMHDLVPNNNSIYNVSTKRAKRNLDSTYLWHCRLAHISKKRIEKLQQEGLLRSTDDESFDQCVSCLSGKMTRKSFPHRPERATDLLGIIHTDVCGPLRHVSRQGASYFITFTDDYSRYGYVYLLKHKHEVFETFKVFKNEVENQLGKTIKALRSDRGGEYISQEFKDYLKACGIVQQLTPPYTPQHNGVSERRNRTLLNMVRSMMNLTTLPLSFWDYALESATRILNMVPTKKALVKRDTSDKLQQRSVKCIFIGYPKETMGYYFYFSPENKIVVTRYDEFFEKNLITQEVSGRAEGLEEIHDEDTSPSEITSEIRMEVEEVEEHSLGDLNEPTSYKAAMLDSESDKWIDAMNAEMQSMIDNMVVGVMLYSHLIVDDIIIMGNHILSLQSVNDYLGKCFAMKDLGEATFILGIKIYRDRSKRLIGLSQSDYMDKILKRYRMDYSKHGHIPMQERLALNKTQGASTPEEVKRMKNVPYASAVSSIMYAVRCTRPDVAFVQNITSHFQQNPGKPHWTAVKTILKYLRNTKDMFLVYGGNPEAELRVECYCDAGFETNRDYTKSQTGYVFILNGGAVDWKSSKQSTTAMSATKAEYIAASEAAMEAVWIRKFILRLGIVPTINEPIKMFCDSSAALHFANKPGVQRGARHYHRRYHYVRESIALGEIKLLKVHTDDNLADPFTKALPNGKLTQHARSMGLRLASSFM